LFELGVKGGVTKGKIPRRVREELQEVSETISKKDPKWARVSEIVEDASTPIEEVSPAMWG